MGLIKLKYIEKRTIRLPYTWALSGELRVASGDTDFINPMFISLGTGQTAKLVKCTYKINSGTSATAKIQKNDIDITEYTNINITTAVNSSEADIPLSDGDKISLVITSVTGTPKNLSFTIFIEYNF
jgi:hypothetical protein